MFPTLNITLGLTKRSRSSAYRLASANKSALELALKFAVWCRDFEGGELHVSCFTLKLGGDDSVIVSRANLANYLDVKPDVVVPHSLLHCRLSVSCCLEV